MTKLKAKGKRRMYIPYGWFYPKLARAGLVSMTVLGLLLFVNVAASHELRPAIADVTVTETDVTIEIELTLEALVAEIDVSVIDNTDLSPNAARYDLLRQMAPLDLEAELRAAWGNLSDNFLIKAGEADLRADVLSVDIPEVGDLDLVRDSKLSLVARLPDDGSGVAVGWTAKNGPIVVRQIGAGERAYAALLDLGELSDPMPRQKAEGGFASRVFRFFFGD